LDTEYELEQRTGRNHRSYAIILRPENPENETQKPKMIGIVGSRVISSEIGYKLHPTYWGKGYMSEALPMFIEIFWSLEGMNTPLKKIK
jgi:RimJ/RimL family protein N-acetyltransferase